MTVIRSAEPSWNEVLSGTIVEEGVQWSESGPFRDLEEQNGEKFHFSDGIAAQRIRGEEMRWGEKGNPD